MQNLLLYLSDIIKLISVTSAVYKFLPLERRKALEQRWDNKLRSINFLWIIISVCIIYGCFLLLFKFPSYVSMAASFVVIIGMYAFLRLSKEIEKEIEWLALIFLGLFMGIPLSLGMLLPASVFVNVLSPYAILSQYLSSGFLGLLVPNMVAEDFLNNYLTGYPAPHPTASAQSIWLTDQWARGFFLYNLLSPLYIIYAVLY